MGGRLLSDAEKLDGLTGLEWVRQTEAELRTLPEFRILLRTTLTGAYDSGTFSAIERVADHVAKPAPHTPRQRLWRIVAKRTIVATGATERPIVFGNNDRPGVMLASAVRTYIHRFGVTPGRNAVVFTNNDDGARTAADLHAAGARVAAIVDARPDPSAAVRRIAEATGARLISGVVRDAQGRLAVTGAQILPHSGTALELALRSHRSLGRV